MGAVAAVRAGVDTWSPAWYLSGPALDHVADRATVKTARGFMLPEPVGDHRVGVIPSVGLVWAEGHPDPTGLACPDELPGHLGRLLRAMHDQDLPVGTDDRYQDGSVVAGVTSRDGFAGVRRLDSTVDLHFADGAEGVAALAGIAGLLRGAPRLKLDTIYATDGKSLETVYLRGKSYAARWYDKGVETGEAARGRWIRPEDQRRFVKATRRGVDELTTDYVRGKFRQRFATLWTASKGVTVAGLPMLTRKIGEAVAAGEISAAQGQLLAGYLLLRDVAPGSRATAYRRESACRDLGLVLADGVLQEVEISLHEILEEVMETPAWGGRG